MSQQQLPQRRRINVRAIIYKDGKILAVKHKTKDGNEASYYCIPGGGLDPLESLIDGVKREVMEETGVEATVGRLLFIQQFASERIGYGEELELFFEVTNADDFEHVDIQATSHGKDELALCEFVDPTTVVLLPKFLSSIDIGSYINGEQPTFIVDNFSETL